MCVLRFVITGAFFSDFTIAITETRIGEHRISVKTSKRKIPSIYVRRDFALNFRSLEPKFIMTKYQSMDFGKFLTEIADLQ